MTGNEGLSAIEREADMLKLFCLPGRLLAQLFSREKKRAYRSVRSRAGYSPGMILISLACWLVLAGGVLFAVDKAGLLKQALDVGVEVAQGNGEQGEGTPFDTGNADETDETAPGVTGSATGGLSSDGQSTVGLPAVTSGTEGTGLGAPPAIEIEQWLVILHTIPKTSRDEAERRKNQYHTKGLEVDILDTDAFHRLRKGSWIIALGPFEDKNSALEAANRARQFTSDLMVRRGL